MCRNSSSASINGAAAEACSVHSSEGRPIEVTAQITRILVALGACVEAGPRQEWHAERVVR